MSRPTRNNPYGHDPIDLWSFKSYDLPRDLPATFCQPDWTTAPCNRYSAYVFKHPDLDSSHNPANQVQEHVFFCGQWHRKLDYAYFAFILAFFLELGQKNPVLWISPMKQDGFYYPSMFYFSVRGDLVLPGTITELTRRISFDYLPRHPRRGGLPIINFNLIPIPFDLARDVNGLPRSPLVIEEPKLAEPNFSSYYDYKCNQNTSATAADTIQPYNKQRFHRTPAPPAPMPVGLTPPPPYQLWD